VLHGPLGVSADQLRRSCIERGLSGEGPVTSLRRRLAEDIKSGKMEPAGQQETAQAAAPTDLPHTGTGNISPSLNETSQAGSEANPAPVLVELLRQVVPQSSEEPEEILRLFFRLREVYDLGLAEDRQFIIRIYLFCRGVCSNFSVVAYVRVLIGQSVSPSC